MSEYVLISCPGCDKVHRVRRDTPSDRRMRCVQCGGELHLPDQTTAPKAHASGVGFGAESSPSDGRSPGASESAAGTRRDAASASAHGSSDDNSQVSITTPDAGENTLRTRRDAASTNARPEPSLDLSAGQADASQPHPAELQLQVEAPAAAPAQCPPGAGRYIERGLIGKGGMGEIVLCVDRNIRRQVAVKRMLPQAAGHPTRRARFVEEAQITGQLEHPNIVPVHELDKAADGTIYFTMKLVKGKSLAEIVEALKNGETTHSLGDLLTIFLKVCDGVAFAHSRGVIHRDLKPANIMVGDYGEVLVMDWGIAKVVRSLPLRGAPARAPDAKEENKHADGFRSNALAGTPHGGRQQAVVSSGRDSGELHTLAGAAIGTPAYMSPEQALGRHDDIDARSDIYSLGCILYELLTLCRPVEGATGQSMLERVVDEKAVPPDQRTPHRHVPRELSAVTMKCLAKAREDRYQGVGELSRDLKLYLEGRSVSAAPDTFTQAFVKLVKRNKGISAAIAAAAVVLIIVTAAFLIRLKVQRDLALASEARAVAERQAAVEARQKERETSLAAARSFAMQAIQLAEAAQWEEAARQADDADDVASESPWGAYARAMFAGMKQDRQEAMNQFRLALRIDPRHAESAAGMEEEIAIATGLQEAASLAPRLDRIDDWRILARAGQALYRGGRFQDCLPFLQRAADLLTRETAAATAPADSNLADVQELLDTATAKLKCQGFSEELLKVPAAEQVRLVQAKLAEIHGMTVRFDETRIENGLWVSAFIRGQKHLRFLYPLKGLPLRDLRVWDAQVKDLSPLRGMPLKELSVPSGKFKDLKPLEGMDIVSLRVHSGAVEDLRALKSMRVNILMISGCPVSDLSPLVGTPLTELYMDGCTRIKDFSPLQSLPLRKISCTISSNGQYILAALAGKPLTWLSCPGATDLQPLKGMTLSHLDARGFSGTLEPLRGMPLSLLNLTNSRIESFEPLRGMPLRQLDIRGTWGPKDLSPLEKTLLEELALRPQTFPSGWEGLRRMKTLRKITVQKMRTQADSVESLTAEEFWRRFDAGELGPQPLHTKAIVPTSQETPQPWRYVTKTPPDDWTTEDFDRSSWSEGPAPFGHVGRPPVPATFRFATDWNTKEIWIVREFHLPELPRHPIRLLMNNDDDAEVYINGIPACETKEWAEYEYQLYPISPQAKASLKVGRNVLAVHCLNVSGNQFIDAGLIQLPPPPALSQTATAPSSQPLPR